jgi:hypothetical protein
MPGGSGQRPRGGSGGTGRKNGDRAGAGPGGNCICPNCGAKTPHEAGVPCTAQKCPECGATMTRE